MIAFMLEDLKREAFEEGLVIGYERALEQNKLWFLKLQELHDLVAGLPNASEIMRRAHADRDVINELLAQYRR